MRWKVRAFTLVEMLVVVGVISTMVAILLPTLNRARSRAVQIECLSNLRQIGIAYILYCQENKGWLPRTAPVATLQQPESPQDFLWWQQETQAPAIAPNRNVFQSPIMRYLGVESPGQKTPTVVDFAERREQVLRCPADMLSDREDISLNGKYFYSYSVNNLMQSLDPSIKSDVAAIPSNAVTGQQFQVAGKLNRVHDPDEKILVVEESEATLNDGSFDPTEQSDGQINGLLSVRHDSTAQLPDFAVTFTKLNANTWTIRNASCRGNVAFCDGHVASVFRSYVNDPTSKTTGDFLACDPLH